MDARRAQTEAARDSVVYAVDYTEPVTIVAGPEGVKSVLLGVELTAREGEASARAVARRAARQIEEYLHGKRRSFDVPLMLEGLSPFQRAVLEVCQTIPFGETWSYSRLAQAAGHRASSARPVGGALARNPVPILVPCHRVLRSDGGLGGFGAGLEWKRRLLAIEGAGQAGRGVQGSADC